MNIRSMLPVLVFSVASSLLAAKPVTSTAAADTKAAASTTTATETPASAIDSREVRDNLRQILSSLPPEVATVLKIDPTLFTDTSYLANYPALAEFVGRHPEVTHNPSYFLENVATVSLRNRDNGGYQAWREILGDIGGFSAFVILTLVFVWIIRTLIEQRRWTRLSRTQAEVHAKLLERLATNDELLAYIQSPAGRRFLESAPIPLEAGPRPMNAPVSRIFWSLQVGLVTTAAGIGLDIASLRLPSGPSEAFYTIAVLALCIGIAFVLSAGVFYLISRKFGLWQRPTPDESVS